jgi:glycosyltransferase involved in cell wall biosynthesis
MQVKILEIISLGYVAGGAEHSLTQIMPALCEKGYNIKTLASDLGADQKHFSDYTFKNIDHAGPLKLLFFLFNPFSFFAVKKLLKEYRPDVVHLHTMNQVTPSVLFLLRKYPTVMTLHGPETFLRELFVWFLLPSHFKNRVYDKNELNLPGKFTSFYFNCLQKFLYRFALKNVDVFIAPSKYIQEAAKADVSPIVHIPNFIELRPFQNFQQNYNLLFVGRLEKVKGVDFLIQALPRIISAFPQTTLTIIGDGSHKAALVDLAKSYRLERYIHFTGWVENKELDVYYQKASMVLVPSIFVEAFGIVILEAMSAGKPVIGTRVGGIPEIIEDGVNGYLVEPKNSEQIAEKVIHLFQEEEILQALGRNARKRAEEFSIEQHAEMLGHLYNELLRKYKLQVTA